MESEEYLSRNPRAGQIEKIGQTEQLEQVAMDRYQLGWEDVDEAVEEYLSETSRWAAFKRVIFG
jgi:hypothetical protein